jgi:homeodomain-containing protein
VAGGGDPGISDRHMRRWRERYVEEGYNGLRDRRRGKPSRRRATVEKVFALYREKYFDLNVQHFHEKLQAEHGIELSNSWVSRQCRERAWWSEDASVGRIASGVSGGRCQGCCCISTAAVTSGRSGRVTHSPRLAHANGSTPGSSAGSRSRKTHPERVALLPF